MLESSMIFCAAALHDSSDPRSAVTALTIIDGLISLILLVVSSSLLRLLPTRTRILGDRVASARLVAPPIPPKLGPVMRKVLPSICDAKVDATSLAEVFSPKSLFVTGIVVFSPEYVILGLLYLNRDAGDDTGYYIFAQGHPEGLKHAKHC